MIRKKYIGGGPIRRFSAGSWLVSARVSSGSLAAREFLIEILQYDIRPNSSKAITSAPY
jgi:hypothetical protein